MLMPVGPPAMILSTLIEVAGLKGKNKQQSQMQVARMLGWMYVISPVMGGVVLGALKVCEAAMKKTGQ